MPHEPCEIIATLTLASKPTHARRCYGLLKDDGLRAAQALAAKLERGALEDGFTLRDVRRNQWQNLTTDDAIEAALDWLERVLASQHRREELPLIGPLAMSALLPSRPSS